MSRARRAQRWQAAFARAEAAVAAFTQDTHSLMLAVQRRYFRALLRRLGRERLQRLGILRRAADLDPELSALLAEIMPELEEVLLEVYEAARQYLRQAGAGPRVSQRLVREAAIHAGFLPDDREALRHLASTAANMIERGVLGSLPEIVRPGDRLRLGLDLAEMRGQARSLREIEQGLMRKWGARYWQAERIVRTTWTATSGQATYLRLLREGYAYKKWIATRDDRVRGRRKNDRHDHLHLDGVIVPIDEPFRDPRSGELLMYPGDTTLGAGPGAVVNCRCTLVGVDRRRGEPD